MLSNSQNHASSRQIVGNYTHATHHIKQKNGVFFSQQPIAFGVQMYLEKAICAQLSSILLMGADKVLRAVLNIY